MTADIQIINGCEVGPFFLRLVREYRRRGCRPTVLASGDVVSVPAGVDEDTDLRAFVTELQVRYQPCWPTLQ